MHVPPLVDLTLSLIQEVIEVEGVYAATLNDNGKEVSQKLLYGLLEREGYKKWFSLLGVASSSERGEKNEQCYRLP